MLINVKLIKEVCMVIHNITNSPKRLNSGFPIFSTTKRSSIGTWLVGISLSWSVNSSKFPTLDFRGSSPTASIIGRRKTRKSRCLGTYCTHLSLFVTHQKHFLEDLPLRHIFLNTTKIFTLINIY